MLTSIRIEKMHFHAHHGVMEQERRVGNEFEVTIEVVYPFEKAMESDDLNDTLNYADIYEIVAEEMSIPSELLENVAGRIVTEIEKRCPQLISFSVRVSKKRPPVDGVAQWSRVTLHSRRK